LSYPSRSKNSNYGNQRRPVRSVAYGNTNHRNKALLSNTNLNHSSPNPDIQQGLDPEPRTKYPILIRGNQNLSRGSWTCKLKDENLLAQVQGLSILAAKQRVDVILCDPRNGQPLLTYRVMKTEDKAKELEKNPTSEKPYPEQLQALKTSLESFGFTLQQEAK